MKSTEFHLFEVKMSMMESSAHISTAPGQERWCWIPHFRTSVSERTITFGTRDNNEWTTQNKQQMMTITTVVFTDKQQMMTMNNGCLQSLKSDATPSTQTITNVYSTRNRERN